MDDNNDYKYYQVNYSYLKEGASWCYPEHGLTTKASSLAV